MNTWGFQSVEKIELFFSLHNFFHMICVNATQELHYKNMVTNLKECKKIYNNLNNFDKVIVIISSITMLNIVIILLLLNEIIKRMKDKTLKKD